MLVGTIETIHYDIAMNSEVITLSDRPVVICGPSGCGKSTVIRSLLQRYPESFYYSVSHTTRPRRPDEVNDRDYHFLNADKFEQLLIEGQFVEHAIFSGYYYGTSKDELHKAGRLKRLCLLDLDIQGMEKIQRTAYNPICIFIRPRNFATLEKRLRSRSTETEDRILQRLAIAHQEMQYGLSEGTFDAVIVNDDLDRTVNEIIKVLTEITQKQFVN
ncbi:p-loop containing nucleoside triphosphate hydrolase [Paragonimus heterotremus]|uniref:guanylate kinase n=1 Tax=Paragonimus heterotremus TaxID=100268 RepID=A0A8J4WCZ3_9TREM|nr:p-loop containing nucleoside triphosphate hydrolase [Paragonimus heterotremus]